MDIGPTFISNKQTSVSMEPGKGALDNPTMFSKMKELSTLVWQFGV